MQLTKIDPEINQEMYSWVLTEQLQAVERAMQVLKDSPSPGYNQGGTTIFFDHRDWSRIRTVSSTQLNWGILVSHILDEESWELETTFSIIWLGDRVRALPEDAISIVWNNDALSMLSNKLRSLSDSLSVEEITRRWVKRFSAWNDFRL
jgi:hypothetical protein